MTVQIKWRETTPAQTKPDKPVAPANPTDETDVEVVNDSVWRRLGLLGLKIGLIAGIGVLLFTLVYGFHHSADPAMHPAVKDGDLTLFYRWDKDYRAGDLVVLRFEGQTQIRRVVAVAGDRVDITEEGLLINGGLQIEPDIHLPTEQFAGGVGFPLVVPEGHIFVLGDARDVAADSRIYGPVKITDTQGTVISVIKRRNL
ncbi:MAG: signal peptidase I [Micrococcales bacterium]|nr:signal peptidase I [Micrococcales bacterium]